MEIDKGFVWKWVANNTKGDTLYSLLQVFLSLIFAKVFGQYQEETAMGSRTLIVAYRQLHRGKKKMVLRFGFLVSFPGFVSFCVSLYFFEVQMFLFCMIIWFILAKFYFKYPSTEFAKWVWFLFLFWGLFSFLNFFVWLFWKVKDLYRGLIEYKGNSF